MKISTMTGRYFVIAASAALFAVVGCGNEKKEQPKAAQETAAVAPAQPVMPPAQTGVPAGHPAAAPSADSGAPANAGMPGHTGMKSQKEVKLSKEVMAKWNTVLLDVTDASSKKKAQLTIKVGSSVTLNNAALKLKVEAFVPDYMITEDHIESRSNEADNPAVLVALLDGDKVVAKGWVFKTLPDFNSYTDPRYPVVLVGPSSENKKK